MPKNPDNMPQSHPPACSGFLLNPRDLVQLIHAGLATLSADGRWIYINPQALPHDNKYVCREGFALQCAIPLVLHSKETFEYLGFKPHLAEQMMSRWADYTDEARTPGPNAFPPFLSCAATPLLNQYSQVWAALSTRVAGDQPCSQSPEKTWTPQLSPGPSPAQSSSRPSRAPSFHSSPPELSQHNTAGRTTFMPQHGFSNIYEQNNMFHPQEQHDPSFGQHYTFLFEEEGLDPMNGHLWDGSPSSSCPMDQYLGQTSQQNNMCWPQMNTSLLNIHAMTHTNAAFTHNRNPVQSMNDTLECRTPEQFATTLGDLTGLRPEAVWNAYHIATDPALRELRDQKDGNLDNSVITLRKVINYILIQRYKLLLQIKLMSEWRAEHWEPEDGKLKAFLEAIPDRVNPVASPRNPDPLGKMLFGVKKAVERLAVVDPAHGQQLVNEMEVDNNFNTISADWTPRPLKDFVFRHSVERSYKEGTPACGPDGEKVPRFSVYDNLVTEKWQGISYGLFWDAIYE